MDLVCGARCALLFALLATFPSAELHAQEDAAPQNLPAGYAGPTAPPPVWGAVMDVNPKTDWIRIGLWDTRFETYAVEKTVEVNGKLESRTMTFTRPVPTVVVHYWPLSALTAATKAGLIQETAGLQALAGKPALFSNHGPLSSEYATVVMPETPFLSIPAPSFEITAAEVALREHLASLGAPIGRIIPNSHAPLAKLFPNLTFFAVQYPTYAADLLPKPLQPYNLAAVNSDNVVRILTSPEQLAAAAKASKTAGELAAAAPAEAAFKQATNPPQASTAPSPADVQYATERLKPEIIKLKLGRVFRPLQAPALNISFPGVTFFPVAANPPAPATSTTPAPAGTTPVPAGTTPAPGGATSGRKLFKERDVVAVDAKGKSTLITCEQGIRSYINDNQEPSPTDKDKRKTMQLFMALAQGKYSEMTFSERTRIKLAVDGEQTVATCETTVIGGGTGKLSVELTFGKAGRIASVRKPDKPALID